MIPTTRVSRRFTLALVLGLLGFSPTCAYADMIVQVGGLRMTFAASYRWYVTNISMNNRDFLSAPSGNGTVIHVVGLDFAGTWHNYETLESADMFVDGVSKPIGNFTYSGDSFMMRRTLNIAGAYRVIHTFTASATGILEHVTMDGLDASKNVDIIYPFLATRANRLTTWKAYDANGLQLSSGTTALDDNSFTYLPAAARGIEQSDPSTGDALTTRFNVSDEATANFTLFVWDRGGAQADNKLYSRVYGFEGFANRHIEVSEALRFRLGNAPAPTDTTPPTVSIGPVTPNPTTTTISGLTITFSEPVTGFDLTDLNLDRANDGLGNLLSAAQGHSVTTTDNRVYNLSGLSNVTNNNGAYTLSIKGTGHGIADGGGNALQPACATCSSAATMAWTKN